MSHPIDFSKLNDNKLFESVENNSKSSIQKKLKDIAVFDYEQIFGLGQIPEVKSLLFEYLGDVNKSELLLENAGEIIGKDQSLLLKENADFFPRGFGAVKPEPQLITESKNINKYKVVNDSVNGDNALLLALAQKKVDEILINPITIDSRMLFFYKDIPVRDQGKRATCVAFSLTSANEYFQYIKKIKKEIYANKKLSEQQLYYDAKLIDNKPNQCGTTLKSGVEALMTKGQCEAWLWKYIDHISPGDCKQNGDCNSPHQTDSRVNHDAINNIPICFELDPTDIDMIKASILAEGCISICVPVYKSWVGAEINGHFPMRIPGEPVTGGHALTIVGYKNEVSYPGGGYFIVKNSWGTQWAKMNKYGKGFGILPYEYVSKYCYEAYTMILG